MMKPVWSVLEAKGALWVGVLLMAGGSLPGFSLAEPGVSPSAVELVAPSDLAAVVSGQTVMLTWSAAPASGPPTNGYIVEASLTPQGPVIASLPVAVPSLTVQDVPDGVYFVRVRSAGGTSKEIQVVVGASRAPRNLSAAVSGRSVLLAWAAPVSGPPASGYVVDASLAPQGPVVASLATPTPTLTVHHVPVGIYYVRVRVASDGIASNEIRIVVGPSLTGAPQIAVIDDPLLVSPPHFFDLAFRSIRFTRTTGGYIVSNEPLTWDAIPGVAVAFESDGAREIQFQEFRFPLGDRVWDSMHVHRHGNVTFGWREDIVATRFTRNAELAQWFADASHPAVAPLYRRGFFSSGASGVSVREASDRVVVTWEVTEGFGHALAFYREPNLNRFQVTLFDSGDVLLSYADVSTSDGLVGVFPGRGAIGSERLLSSEHAPQNPQLAPYLDIVHAQMHQLDGVVRVTYQLRAAPPGPMSGLEYRFFVDTDLPFENGVTIPLEDRDCYVRLYSAAGEWAATHCGGPATFGSDGPTVWMELPLSAIDAPATFQWAGDAVDFTQRAPCCWFDRASPSIVSPSVGELPSVIDLSELQGVVRPGATFEVFHYPVLAPNGRQTSFDVRAEEVAKRFYAAYEDSYDFLIMLTNFRFDSQEPGGSYSLDARTGTERGLGKGTTDNTAVYGSQSVLNGGLAPTWLHAPMFDASTSGEAFADHAAGLFLIAHEIGHTWLARMEAQIGGERVRLFDEFGHWLTALHAPSLVPIRGPTDRSPMGGGVWKGGSNVGSRNYVPTGFSPLDLYAMGLMDPAEVPPFGGFVDGALYPITIADVIAAMGPRLPAHSESKRAFTAAFILVAWPGTAPTPSDLERADSVRRSFEQYFSAATGGRASISTTLRPR